MAGDGVKMRVVEETRARVAANLKKIGSDSDKLLQRAIQQTAVQIQTDAKRNAPVQFGLLRASIYRDYKRSIDQSGNVASSVTIEGRTRTLRQVMRTPSAQSDRNGLNAYVGSDLEYAQFMEEGTKYIRGRYFLKNAYDKHAPRLNQAIDKIITQLVK